MTAAAMSSEQAQLCTLLSRGCACPDGSRRALLQLITYVANGGRLEIPQPGQVAGGAFEEHDAFVALIRRCLAQTPAERPGFAELVDLLG